MPLSTPSTPGIHEVLVTSGNGMGSVNTAIRRFLNVDKNVGTAIVYTDSATAGAAFTITSAGSYAVTYGDGGSGDIGISVNADPTTPISSTTTLARYSWFPAAGFGQVSATMRLAAGDVIRPHCVGNYNLGASAYSAFRVTKIAN